MTRVLVVEDDPRILADLTFQLRDHGLATESTGSAEGALAALGDPASSPPDLLLLDVRLPGRSGVELVRELADAGRLPPTVILSGEASISETVEALNLGVHDFIEKPVSKERLLRSVDNALSHAALRDRVERLETELGQGPAILGESPAVRDLRRKIARVAPTDIQVLILGESGTGKELVAEALHRGSTRSAEPLIKINCAAISHGLIEDELFGHVKGAFTDARTDRAGVFEEADGGTLFLDEIGDMDLGLQARLLRVLEDGRVRRVGSNEEHRVDVRVVAATHHDLQETVRRGAFREDLYFRLAHFPLEVSPLRDRPEDIRPLFDHFLQQARRRYKRRPIEITDEVYSSLERAAWPGNVRQLKALAEQLLVLGENPVGVEHLPASLTAGDRDEAPSTGPIRPLKSFLRESEKSYLEAVLEECGWNVSEAARRLELQRTHLHQKLSSLGIERPHGR